jgi:hypothetical protein
MKRILDVEGLREDGDCRVQFYFHDRRKVALGI